MPRFRLSLGLILVCIATPACGDETTNPDDEVGETETSTDGSTSTDESSSTSTDESTSNPETTDESTSDSETTDESTSDSETTDESTSDSETSGPICGDGMVDVGEECDDGNDVDDDACANDCTVTAEGFLIEVANPAVNVAITDNGYNGLQGSMTCTALAVPDAATVVDVTAEFGISHTFTGDVTAKLISPTGTIVTMFSRPGMVEMGDNGTGCCGETADLAASSPLRFNDQFLVDPESMGGPLGTNGTICLDDMACDYMTNPGSAAPGTMADFVGESVTGNWIFCVADSSMGDTGELVGIGLSILAVD